jgi:hypothetical protein
MITSLKYSTIEQGLPKYRSSLVGYPGVMPAPTAADGGNGTSATVSFTAVSGTTTYRAISNPGSLTGTSSTSPITVSGLTAGTAYTFQIRGENTIGNGAYSAASNSVTPVDPAAFVSIATATGTGSSSTISFTSIPGTYQHLQIRGVTSCTTGTDFQFYIGYNSDTGSNYAYHQLRGNGTSASATGSSSSAPTIIARSNTATSTVNPVIIDIHDYASTTKNKVARSFNGWDNNGSGDICLISNLWRSTSAITRIDLTTTNNWSTSTQFALYGIKA